MTSHGNHPPLVRMIGIGKRFGPVPVLSNVDLEIYPGEVQILAGENGAGKSTLMKILAGVHVEYDGTIEIAGQPTRFRSPWDANRQGVAVIYQELSLAASMSAADNIFLGREQTHWGFVDDAAQQRAAAQLLRQLGLDIDVRRPVSELSIGCQQLVEIAKALSHDARVLVMDEPTSALSAPEVERLFDLVARLKAEGRGIVYITHKMEEIERIADRITVLRDGRLVGSRPAAELPPARLIQWMVGREIDQQFPKRTAQIGNERLRVEGFSVLASRGGAPAVDRVSLTVRAGEIVGIGGLQGSGASELCMALFEGRHRSRGNVWLDGRPFRPGHPRRAVRRGLALLTNDRKATGLVLGMSITANATMASLDRLCRAGWRRPRREYEAASKLGQSLRLRAASLGMPVGELSGGNQQKVVLAKWLATAPRVLLLDEPTRGVDVGAKHEIYELIHEWTASGIAVVLITSEMPELLALCDRIVVMHRGQITAEMSRHEASAEAVLEAAMGHTAAAAGC